MSELQKYLVVDVALGTPEPPGLAGGVEMVIATDHNATIAELQAQAKVKASGSKKLLDMLDATRAQLAACEDRLARSESAFQALINEVHGYGSPYFRTALKHARAALAAADGKHGGEA